MKKQTKRLVVISILSAVGAFLGYTIRTLVRGIKLTSQFMKPIKY